MPHQSSDDRTVRCDECGGFMWRGRCADSACPGHKTGGLRAEDYARELRMREIAR